MVSTAADSGAGASLATSISELALSAGTACENIVEAVAVVAVSVATVADDGPTSVVATGETASVDTTTKLSASVVMTGFVASELTMLSALAT